MRGTKLVGILCYLHRYVQNSIYPSRKAPQNEPQTLSVAFQLCLHHGSLNRVSLTVTMIHVLLWAFNRTESAAELILVAPIPNQKVVQNRKELYQHLSAASREEISCSNLQTKHFELLISVWGNQRLISQAILRFDIWTYLWRSWIFFNRSPGRNTVSISIHNR